MQEKRQEPDEQIKQRELSLEEQKKSYEKELEDSRLQSLEGGKRLEQARIRGEKKAEQWRNQMSKGSNGRASNALSADDAGEPTHGDQESVDEGAKGSTAVTGDTTEDPHGENCYCKKITEQIEKMTQVKFEELEKTTLKQKADHEDGMKKMNENVIKAHEEFMRVPYSNNAGHKLVTGADNKTTEHPHGENCYYKKSREEIKKMGQVALEELMKKMNEDNRKCSEDFRKNASYFSQDELPSSEEGRIQRLKFEDAMNQIKENDIKSLHNGIKDFISVPYSKVVPIRTKSTDRGGDGPEPDVESHTSRPNVDAPHVAMTDDEERRNQMSFEDRMNQKEIDRKRFEEYGATAEQLEVFDRVARY